MTDWSPFWLSLKVSAWATFFSVTVGTAIALPLAKRFIGRSMIIGITNLPLVLPPTVLGYFLLVSFSSLSPLSQYYQKLTGHELAFTWQGAVLAACLTSIPLYIANARLSFSMIEPDILNAARLDGANKWEIFLQIIAPLSQAGIVAGTTLAFARALGDFGATLMFAGDMPGAGRTMPVAIYDALQIGDNGTVRTYVMILVALCIIICLAAARIAPQDK